MLEKTCLFISSRLKRAAAPPPHLQRGGPFEEGFEGDFARDFLLRAGEDIFIVLIIVMIIAIVIAIAIVIIQSKALRQSSGEAEKYKS